MKTIIRFDNPQFLAKFYFLSFFKSLKRPLILFISLLCLTSVFGYHFYNQPQLAINTISPITIKAPRDGKFEDIKTTEVKRQQVRAGITPILKRNDQITRQIQSNLSESFAQITLLRKIARSPLTLKSNSLSKETEEYLISCSPEAWQEILNSLAESSVSSNPATKSLQNYREQTSPQDFQLFLNQITKNRQQYQQVQADLSQIINQPIDFTLIKMSETDWQQFQQITTTTLEKILTQGIPPGLPLDLLQDTIQVHLKDVLSSFEQQDAQTILISLLAQQSNLEENQEATQQSAIQAVQAVPLEMVSIKKGEIIVKADETITQKDFVFLDNFQLSRREINWEGLVLTGILVSSAVAFFCLVESRVHRRMRQRDHLLLCFLSISTPLLAIANIPYTNLAAVGLLTSSFYGPTLAITQILLVSGLSFFAIDAPSWPLMAGTVGGLVAAAVAGRLRSRDELAILGAGVGLIQGVAYLLIYLIASSTAGTIWYTVLPYAFIKGLSGLAWSIFALGISPYLERFFDLVTPIRLVELANLNRPLLQRLVTEAPGTFQHTLFVACLAEAAGRKLHCNVELIRTGTLYHDIGKMHDPQGFIENQMGGVNKHDVINNPWLSAAMIKKHISEGLVMARKYGLPKVVRDFIPEHQGTLSISYFYQQAKATHQWVDERDFRYDGPIPQSRETGIVMLADSCEAALRSLKNATPEQAKEMIHKIFAARWRENQLKDSGLRRDELNLIAEVFIQVWQQYNHQRIAYPKAILDPRCAEKH